MAHDGADSLGDGDESERCHLLLVQSKLIQTDCGNKEAVKAE